MNSFSCFLPWPPTINTYYTVIRGRKAFSKKGLKFKKDCIPYLQQGLFVGCDQLKGRLEVCIFVNRPDKRRRDLDNLLKPVLDALGNYGVYEDDSQIDDIRIAQTNDLAKGEFTIMVMEIENVNN